MLTYKFCRRCRRRRRRVKLQYMNIEYVLYIRRTTTGYVQCTVQYKQQKKVKETALMTSSGFSLSGNRRETDRKSKTSSRHD